MPRRKLIRTHRAPYHVMARTIDKEFFPLPLDVIWEIALTSLKGAYSLAPIELIAFVLMGNHYHMILSTPESNIDQFMYEFHKRFAKLVNEKLTRPKPIFSPRYKWSIVRTQSYLANCYRYIYQNPVRANLCQLVEDYPYSTIQYIARGREFSIPIHDKFGFKDQFCLNWLNEKISEDDLAHIRKVLKKEATPKSQEIKVSQKSV